MNKPTPPTRLTGTLEPEPRAQLGLSLFPSLRQLDAADADLLAGSDVPDGVHRQRAECRVERAVGIRDAAVADARVVSADDEFGPGAAGIELDAVVARDGEEAGGFFDFKGHVGVAAARDEGVEVGVEG